MGKSGAREKGGFATPPMKREGRLAIGLSVGRGRGNHSRGRSCGEFKASMVYGVSISISTLLPTPYYMHYKLKVTDPRFTVTGYGG
eukprot:scaffold147685_cov31-Tisochrysis_lutea.AAC.1